MAQTFDNFIALIQHFILPIRQKHPDGTRLDGRTAFDPSPTKRAGLAAHVKHAGKTYRVDADCRIDNLLAAHEAWIEGRVEYPVKVGPSRYQKKKLVPWPGAADGAGFFIYNPEAFSEQDAADDGYVRALEDDPGSIDPLTLVAVNRAKRNRKFRDRVLRSWGPICPLTGCQDIAVIDAAHIEGFARTGDNRTSNGIPLRTDLNRLMETGGLSFKLKENALIATVAGAITWPEYRRMNGKVIVIPSTADRTKG